MLQNLSSRGFFLHPKGVMLWSLKSIEIFWEQCQEDILYLDATGSIKKKEEGAPPFYVYELVVRIPQKSCPLSLISPVIIPQPQ